MGIRFRCHHCEHELHVKDFQGGKRGRCPACQGKFRIPLRDAEHSLEPDASGEAERPQPAAATVPSPQRTSGSVAVSGSKTTDRPAALPTKEADVATPPPAVATTNGPPRALGDAPQATWFVRPPSGGQYGPAPSDAMWQWLQENRISRDSLVWCEGWPEWLAASQVFADFFPVNRFDAAGDATGPNMAAVPAPGTNGTPADTSAATISGPQSASASDRSRATRKQRRKRNYTMLIAILSVLMIVLLIALFVVLNSQRAAG